MYFQSSHPYVTASNISQLHGSDMENPSTFCPHPFLQGGVSQIKFAEYLYNLVNLLPICFHAISPISSKSSGVNSTPYNCFIKG
nr:MAG TPA: hypothetical protein [Bacteriophage sp.]DAX06051.1 MAG TPA: hypothetical protein [Bacteriophage sp.]